MATQLGPAVQIAAHDLFSESTTQLHNLGEIVTSGCRRFAYARVGASALVVANLLQSAAEKTNHQNLTAPASAIGVTSVAVTLGATAATANEYSKGWLVVTVTPGLGYAYEIASHPAADASASLTLTLSDPIEVALTSTSRLDLVHNPYFNVIQYPTTASSGLCGSAVNNIAASSYGWVGVGGPQAILADGALTVGVNLSASNAVAGAVEAAVTAQAAAGWAMSGIADTEVGPVFLTCR